MLNDNQMPPVPKPSQTPDIGQEIERIREEVQNKMPPVEEFVRAALAFFDYDIADSTLEAISQQNRDVFILRANQVGVALTIRGAYHYAASVYEALLSKAENFIQNTGKPLHLGAIKVNLGVVLILAGNFDAGVSAILETATQDDVKTYRILPTSSYALKLLHDVVLDQVIAYVVIECTGQFRTATGFQLGPEAVSTMANHCNPLGEVALVSLRPLIQHPAWQQRASTQFGRIRIMDGLRWLSATLENMAIFIGQHSLRPQTSARFANNPEMTLWSAYGHLFTGEQWWSVAEQNVGTTSIGRNDSGQDIVQKYQQLFTMPENSREELLSKTVLISRLTRNLSAHFLEMPDLMVNQISQQVVRFQLLAQLLIFDWAYREGHFTQLSPPGVWPR